MSKASLLELCHGEETYKTQKKSTCKSAYFLSYALN